MSEKYKHKAFAWEYFDRGISKSSKGVSDEAKCKNCAAVIKCTGGLTSGFLWHLKSKHSIEKPSSTQSGVPSNTQSANSTKRFKSAYSQATLRANSMNKRLEKTSLIKLLLQMVFLPVLSVKVNLSVKPVVIMLCLLQKSKSCHAIST